MPFCLQDRVAGGDEPGPVALQWLEMLCREGFHPLSCFSAHCVGLLMTAHWSQNKPCVSKVLLGIRNWESRSLGNLKLCSNLVQK